jgi:hypothetical protein
VITWWLFQTSPAAILRDLVSRKPFVLQGDEAVEL